MKFFLSQMEISKEAVRVGTLALIRAVVSADGEHSRRRKTGRELGWQVSLISGLFFFFLNFWPHPAAACGILVPCPEIEPLPPALEAPSLKHWTSREVPGSFPLLQTLLGGPRSQGSP